MTFISKQYRRAYYRKNKKRILEQNKEYRKKHPKWQHKYNTPIKGVEVNYGQ